MAFSYPKVVRAQVGQDLPLEVSLTVSLTPLVDCLKSVKVSLISQTDSIQHL